MVSRKYKIKPEQKRTRVIAIMTQLNASKENPLFNTDKKYKNKNKISILFLHMMFLNIVYRNNNKQRPKTKDSIYH